MIEGISWIDGLYFTIVTQSTVGYGDITPQTNAGLIFNFCFVIISFAVIIILFNIIFDYWFDERITELCEELQDEQNYEYLEKKRWKFMQRFGFGDDNAEEKEKEIKEDQKKMKAEVKSKKEKQAHQKKIYFRIYLCIYVGWVILWVTFFAANPKEEETFFEALYFAVITSTTVGYGMFSPQTNGGKLFVFFFLNLGVKFNIVIIYIMCILNYLCVYEINYFNVTIHLHFLCIY